MISATVKSSIFAALIVSFALVDSARITHAQDLAPLASVSYRCKGSKPTDNEIREASQSAKAAILEQYFAGLPSERKTVLSNKKETILASADNYINHFVVRDQQFDKKTKTLTLAVGADIDETKISKLIDTAGSAGKVETQGERQKIVFIFAARRQSEVESKGPKVSSGTKQIDSNAQEVGTSNDGEVNNTKIAKVSVQATETASSVTRTADRVVYSIDDNFKADIDGAMSGVFVNRGLKVVSAVALVDADNNCDPDELQKDFDHRSQLTLKHQSLVAKTCKAANIPLLAYGTLTILVKRTDSASGNTLVTVKVDAQIFDCRDSSPIKVGSVSGLLVEGIGADQSEAEGQSIKLASEKAANALVDQMSLTSIR